MPDPTSAARTRIWRQRQAGTLACPCCELCGRPHRGKYAPLCQPCWERTTPEGLAAVAARQREYRARRRAKVTVRELGGG